MKALRKNKESQIHIWKLEKNNNNNKKRVGRRTTTKSKIEKQKTIAEKYTPKLVLCRVQQNGQIPCEPDLEKKKAKICKVRNEKVNNHMCRTDF